MRLGLLFSFVFTLTLVAACGDDGRRPTPDSSVVDTSVGDGTVDSGVDTCGNGRRDGTETSIDCGGSCPPCADGQMCTAPSDCQSMVCRARYCLVPSCMDAIQNGDETAVDCGGDCGGCMGGQPCTAGTDCISGRCLPDGTCEASGCEDGILNQDETDVDCGGAICPACAGDQACLRDEDCESLICDVGTCTTASCTDRVQNQDETSVDCGGGICPACPDRFSCLIDPDCEGMRCVMNTCVSCMDGVQNAEETDVDCGGGLCSACADGLMCTADTDCTGGTCESGACVSCVDGVQNQDETDVDCGGTICPGCADGDACTAGTDCTSTTCEASTCVSCMDGVINQDETDADCGGTVCPGCGTGGMCTGASDCTSLICDAATSLCNAPGCGDGVLNGMETDLDCGGGSCLGCATGLDCVLGRDCLDGVCMGGTCQAPTCTDGVANGLETDIDCGGSSTCPRCMDGRLCPNGPSDCISPLCTSGRCGDVRGHLVLMGHDFFSTNAGQDRVLGNTVLMAPETGMLDVLIYDQYADRSSSGEVVRTEAAILREMGTAGRTVTFRRLTDYTMLTTALTSATDVFIVAEQESGSGAPWATIAAAWESTLRGFLGAGGVVITLNYFDNGWQTLDRPMLVEIGAIGTASGTNSVVPAASTHPIAAGVMPYAWQSGTSSYTGVMMGGAISITPIIQDASGRIVVYDALF